MSTNAAPLIQSEVLFGVNVPGQAAVNMLHGAQPAVCQVVCTGVVGGQVHGSAKSSDFAVSRDYRSQLHPESDPPSASRSSDQNVQAFWFRSDKMPIAVLLH